VYSTAAVCVPYPKVMTPFSEQSVEEFAPANAISD
jgi:hypothetical protein